MLVPTPSIHRAGSSTQFNTNSMSWKVAKSITLCGLSHGRKGAGWPLVLLVISVTFPPMASRFSRVGSAVCEARIRQMIFSFFLQPFGGMFVYLYSVSYLLNVLELVNASPFPTLGSKLLMGQHTLWERYPHFASPHPPQNSKSM